MMEQCWRWFGPDDVVPLAHVAQAGATGIVTALHDVPAGVEWTREAIAARQHLITAPGLGLAWSVVESLPVHEKIKIGEGDLEPLFDTYRRSIRNLAAQGIFTICYNFMPVLDWTRTRLDHPTPTGARALRYNAHEFAAFDCFILARPGAQADHRPEAVARARAWLDQASAADKQRLIANISAGLPGAFDRYDIDGLRVMLARYKDVSKERLRDNLRRFLQAVMPTAEETGVRLAIHPDDPPWPLMGLPRIVGSADDLAFILDAYDAPGNGLTFCTGSLGAGAHNDVGALARRFASRVHFAHLRNVTKDADGSFQEADHLGGDVDMVGVIRTLLAEQTRRRAAGEERALLPFRPDHGHEMLDDLGKKAFPGYSAIGRLRGLAEIRGVMAACIEPAGLGG